MTATTESAAGGRSTPWHFWLVAVLAVLWNGFGAYDYTMSHLQGATYYRQMGMTDAQIAFMDTYPTWMHAVWAIGVWGSVLGTILLLIRSRWAQHAFGVSLIGALGNLAYTALTPGAMAAQGIVMPCVILALCAAFLWYSWAMTKRGVLR